MAAINGASSCRDMPYSAEAERDFAHSYYDFRQLKSLFVILACDYGNKILIVHVALDAASALLCPTPAKLKRPTRLLKWLAAGTCRRSASVPRWLTWT